jgi:hypothetical protein
LGAQLLRNCATVDLDGVDELFHIKYPAKKI